MKKDSRIKILLVEDDPDQIYFIKRILNSDRYSLNIISDGKSALELLLSNDDDVDVVLLDYHLPTISGMEILEKTSNSKKKYATILMTFDSSIDVVVKAMRSGANDFIVKSGDYFSQIPEVIEKVNEINKDRIERKRIEKQLEEIEGKYIPVVDNISEGIAILQGEYIQYVNKALLNLSGYTEEELLSISFIDFVHSGDRAMVANYYQKRMKGESVPKEYTIRLKVALEQVLWVRLKIERIFYKKEPAALLFASDITEELHAKALEKRQKKNLEFLSNTAMRFVNFPVDENIFEYIALQLLELVGDSIVFINFIDDKKKQLLVKSIVGSSKLVEKMEDVLEDKICGMSFDLPDIIIESLSSGALIELEGDFNYFTFGQLEKKKCLEIEKNIDFGKIYSIGFVHDNILYGNASVLLIGENKLENQKVLETFIKQASIVLQKRETEINLKKSKEKAEESDRLKSAFLANMSHEIRTPMNAILGFSGLLNSPEVSAEKKSDYIEYINNSGNTLLNLIDDVIDIAKIEAGEIILKQDVCSINRTLDELYESFLDIKKKKNKEHLRLRLRKGVNDKELGIITDPYRFRQVVSNLIENAIKFTNEGYIKFGYFIEDKSIRFYVKDTGVGVSEADQKSIFKRFRRLEGDTSSLTRGAGLGLAISKNIINLLEGEMWVESEVGKGSIFSFTLPYRLAKVNQTNVVKEKQPSYDWSGKTILIAEDEDINYIFLKEILKKTNVNIIRAVNGEEAVNVVSSKDGERVSLVLMDMRMSVMDGFEATPLIKKQREDIVVIAQTAYAMVDERENCMKVGCDDFLTKPIKSQSLLEMVNKYI